jgi:hypothetical protein
VAARACLGRHLQFAPRLEGATTWIGNVADEAVASSRTVGTPVSLKIEPGDVIVCAGQSHRCERGSVKP